MNRRAFMGVGSSSPTQITDGSGGPRGNETYYPYGQEWNYVNGVSNYWQYYGGYSRYEWDIGLYLTPTRSYSPLYGRWLTPDPMGGDVTNPQSLNRYAYVLNNPATLNDPLGLDPFSGDSDGYCSDPSYLNNDPECGWNPCWGLTPEGWSQSNCGGLPAGIAGGGGGSMLPPVPPAGQPPLAGMGNASFPNGSKVCSIIYVPGVGPRMSCNWTLFPSPGVMAAIGATVGSFAAYLLHKPWEMSWTVPLLGEPGAAGVGPSGSFYWNPATRNFCGSVGIGLAGGRTGTIGPVTNAWTRQGVPATPSQVDNIFRGLSWSVGLNVPSPGSSIGPGVQVSGNGAGMIVNPNIGNMGVGISDTFGGCTQLW